LRICLGSQITGRLLTDTDINRAQHYSSSTEITSYKSSKGFRKVRSPIGTDSIISHTCFATVHKVLSGKWPTTGITFWYFLRSIDRNRGSLVNIVSACGLDDRAIGVQSPAEAKDFSSSFRVHTGSEAHPASYTMGTGGPFPEGKTRLGRDADTSPPKSLHGVS
jgi:hypothetical protein